MEHIEVAEAPAGQQYTVVTAPRGSALDAGGRFGTGGIAGGLVAVGMVVARSARKGWRIAVTPCDGQGRPTGRSYMERLADQKAAEARSAAVALAIRSGRWPEPQPAPMDE
ncbi:MAG TPA: hypothetical protein VM784_09625 [Actinomycetota bacterium]|nr:hypothetical protein [Actinomycetota bacterium]